MKVTELTEGGGGMLLGWHAGGPRGGGGGVAVGPRHNATTPHPPENQNPAIPSAILARYRRLLPALVGGVISPGEFLDGLPYITGAVPSAPTA